MLHEMARKTILAFGRTLARLDNLDNLNEAPQSYHHNPPTTTRNEDGANLVCSLLDRTDARGHVLHAPALDIDLPCYTVPSSTPGHSHLYIDKELTWSQYKALLAVLAEVGIIEKGYYQAAVANGASYLRLPGVTKKQPSETEVVADAS